MNPENRLSQMKTIQAEALELFKKKNVDYGDAFASYGTIGILIRIQDKLKRFISITKNGVNLVNDESLRDTLIDLHNYSAMGLMLLGE
jgi:elongation factor P--beta-lysine ligase